MTEKRYSRMTNHYGTSRTYCTGVYDNQNNRELKNASQVITELNALHEENEQLKSDLKDCRKLKTKRLNKIRNHRAVIEDLGGSIRAYKGKLSQANDKIEKIQEAMEDTGALTKRQLEEILND